METGRWARWAPLTGVLAIAIVLIAFIAVGGSTPDTKASAEKVYNYYKDHRSRQMGAAFLVMIGAAIFVMFAAVLRGALARGSVTHRSASIAFGGGIIAAGGFFLMSTIHIALADSGKYGDATVAHALNILDTDNYVPMAAGIGLMVFGAGISLVTTRMLPLWFGIVGIVFGLVTFTPLGFFGLLASALWLIVISIWMTVRPLVPASIPLPAA
ncbi:MAG: hypothetical protein ACJ735_01810 [Actinomycetes bacterium]